MTNNDEMLTANIDAPNIATRENQKRKNKAMQIGNLNTTFQHLHLTSVILEGSKKNEDIPSNNEDIDLDLDSSNSSIKQEIENDGKLTRNEINGAQIESIISPKINIESLGLAESFDPSTIVENTKNGSEKALYNDINNIIYNGPAHGQKILCRIVRRKNGVDAMHPIYDLMMESNDGSTVFLLSARKRTTFTVYDNGINPFKVDGIIKEKGQKPRQEICSVLYEPNVLGFKGPRKMTILLPSMLQGGIRTIIQPRIKSETILERYKENQLDDILTLYNKSPQWNEETQSYVLNFNGRVTMASVKNFQVVHKNDLDYVVLQFGRVSPDVFTMDFQYPLNALQAFGIALTSFDAKLACE
ncbi:Tubby domain-containing protein [Rozella allomycis CSF55]|uniref:Tubby domain-containing protein n=1 Tax=Rozella allomycis (strain CSF55) TaxID=988480 RepID=A0A075B337_ROZAC|nr:Tubby domain-containing protein [Rozella allomycis CSF55]|eukprot:EPZ35386.1 Tubby domain-containing protein [Rozella allomycis CSF55]